MIKILWLKLKRKNYDPLQGPPKNINNIIMIRLNPMAPLKKWLTRANNHRKKLHNMKKRMK